MEQKDKNLLLQDLCSRLPYGVILNCCDSIGEKLIAIDVNGLVNYDYDIDEVKPYLFPLSSMTIEQKEEERSIKEESYYSFDANGNIYTLQDFYNKNHFDYRGLIPMDLANDATGLNIY